MFTNFKQNYDSLEFKISGVDISIVNGIRRVIHSDVKTISPDFKIDAPGIDFSNCINNTSLTNEYLLHRMALIPMHLSLEEMEDVNILKYKVGIDVDISNKNGSETFTSENFYIKDENGNKIDKSKVISIYPPCKITNDYPIFMKLTNRDGRSNKLKFELPLKKSNGKEHSRFSPVSVCFHKYCVNHVEFDKKLAEFERNIPIDLPESKKKRKMKEFEIDNKSRCFVKNKFNEPCEFEFHNLLFYVKY